jgi:DNA modification methylase
MSRRPKASWSIYFHSSEDMHEIDGGFAQIAIASPPFTNHSDGKTLDKTEYTNFIKRVFSEIYRITKPGGVLVTVNTDLRDHARYNGGDSSFNGLIWHKHSTLRQIAEIIGFRCTDTKIWAKSLNRNVYRYTFSYIQFFRKPGSSAKYAAHQKVSKGFGPDVWLLEGGTYRRDAYGYIFRDAIHPEIVKRCLEQFTSPNDLVVCPFVGSGTVVAVAHMMGRRSIGYEVNLELKPMIVASIETPDLFTAYKRLIQ